jgi:lipoyl(octanoyl) transferase
MQIKRITTPEYTPVYAAMREFTAQRTPATEDEIWLAEHGPAYTLGLAGRREHVLNAHDIPVIATDRGGQVTYHGPGQVVAYPLIDLRRQGIYVKEYVHRIETAVICVLADYGVIGQRVANAPGIYVRLDGRAPSLAGSAGPQPAGADPFAGLGKIAALGVKVTNHRTYHGVALNVAMDLAPFTWINPCGYAGLATVDLATLGVQTTWDDAAARLAHHLARVFTLPADTASPASSS